MSLDRDNGATISKEQQQQQLHQDVRVRLMNERPTMDQALKSFASWMMVHTTASSSNNATAAAAAGEGELSWTTADVLKMTRWLSIHINQHIVSIATIVQKQQEKSSCNTTSGSADNDSTTTRLLLNALVPQFWNELVGQKTKVTKLLGRTSLQIVWADLDLVQQLLEEKGGDDDESWLRKLCIYLQYFERFLFAESTLSTTATAAESTITSKSVMLDGQDVVALPFTPDMSDAKLIWDADGGQAELARRASGRQKQAAERRLQMEEQAAAAAAAASNKQSMKPPPPQATSSSSSVVITEINEKDETKTKQGGAQEKAE